MSVTLALLILGVSEGDQVSITVTGKEGECPEECTGIGRGKLGQGIPVPIPYSTCM